MENERTFSFRTVINWEMEDNDDSFDNAEYCSLTDDELDHKSDPITGHKFTMDHLSNCGGYGFLVWTKDYIYYRDYERTIVQSIPRHPTSKPTVTFPHHIWNRPLTDRKG